MLLGVHHIVLFCQDTVKSKLWYEKVGFTFLRGYEGMFWFQFGSTQIMLHPTNETNPGLTTLHVAVESVEKLFEHVTKQSLEPIDHQQPGIILETPVQRPWGDYEFELRDPDGHKWAFTEIRNT